MSTRVWLGFNGARLFALLAAVLVSAQALASNDAILRCRGLAVPAERFACYEAIVVAPPAGGAASAQAAVRPAAPVPAPLPPQTPAASPAGTGQADFGLESRLSTAPLPPFIESTIRGRFQGWGPQDIIELANGQRWQISDDSRGVLIATDPKVKIRRGALGAFYLELEGTNRSPKVRRLP
jgi:hypothetical protein